MICYIKNLVFSNKVLKIDFEIALLIKVSFVKLKS